MSAAPLASGDAFRAAPPVRDGTRVGPANRIVYNIVAERGDLLSSSSGSCTRHRRRVRNRRRHLMLFGCSLNAADDPNRDLQQAATRRYDVTAAAGS